MRFVVFALLFLSPLAHAEFRSVCERPEVIQTILSLNTGKKCADITEQDLHEVTQLSIYNWGLITIHSGDFSGMPNVNSVTVVDIENLILGPNFFSEMPQLSSLLFEGTPIRSLRAGMFSHLPKLKSLGFNWCGIEEIEPGALRGLIKLENIVVVDHKIKHIRAGVFVDLPNLTQIQLQQGPLLDQIDDDSFAHLPKIKTVIVGESTNVALKDRVISPLKRTRKAAFRNVPEVIGLPPDFDIENTSDQWGAP